MKYQAKITRTIQEAPDVTTLFFTIDGGMHTYTAGQYIAVYAEINGNKWTRAYSLSSAPHEKEGAITVKNIGMVSGYLCALQPGDTLEISSVFGFFNAQGELPIIAIAAGVGIAPLWSIIKDELQAQSSRSIELYLTAARAEDLVFRTYIDEACAEHPRLRATYFTTQASAPGATPRRIAVADDISSEALRDGQFYICGSEQFVRALWLQLMQAGVDESRVVTETFFESSV